MAKRPIITTKDHLINAALPEATETYTVISHEFIINKTLETLKNNNFVVDNEFYKCNENASVAQGIYHIHCEDDEDLGMMFAWANSYDKSMRFRCTIGGFVHISNNRLIANKVGSWGRKHTGTADEETEKTIEEQITNAEKFFRQLIHDKNAMKQVTVTAKERAELTGRMYLINELLTAEQLAVVKEQYKNPSFDYGVPHDNLWAMYNAILTSLHRAHPRMWIEQQRLMHFFFTKEFGIKPLALVDAEKQIAAALAGQPIPEFDNGVVPYSPHHQMTLEEGIENAEKEKTAEETAEEISDKLVEKIEEQLEDTQETKEAAAPETEETASADPDEGIKVENSEEEKEKIEELKEMAEAETETKTLDEVKEVVERAEDTFEEILDTEEAVKAEEESDQDATESVTLKDEAEMINGTKSPANMVKEELTGVTAEDMEKTEEVMDVKTSVPEGAEFGKEYALGTETEASNETVETVETEDCASCDDEKKEETLDVFELDESAEDMEETKEEIFELDADDNSWPCLKCGEMQGAEAIFHDGQLCTKCAESE